MMDKAHAALQGLYEQTRSELESMVGDTNLFLSEGGKHAEVGLSTLLIE
jgi:hypothetical protein